jgi:hypothetical protein
VVRHHDGAHRSVGGAEHALEELALLALFLADRGLDHEAQLLEGELAFRVIRGRHPQHRQHDLGADVEDDEGRVDRVVEDLEDARREAGHVLGALDGERLGDELAHHDVEARDHAEADAARDGLDEVLGDVQEFEQRAEDPRERGLSQPAEAQRREGDAQLRGGEELVEALLKTQGARRGCVTRLRPRLEGRGAHFRQRELCRDEEAVGEHTEERSDQREHVRLLASSASSPRDAPHRDASFVPSVRSPL